MIVSSNQHILVTGGARSGKSNYAEKLVLGLSSRPVYVATCEIFDSDMAARVKLHKERRGDHWQEIHAPLNLAMAIKNSDNGAARLVDCLTYWVNNLLYHKLPWEPALDELITVLKVQKSPVVFVTNEIGMGIIPETKLGREFRDVAGSVNQAIASEVSQMYLVLSGQPMKVKP